MDFMNHLSHGELLHVIYATWGSIAMAVVGIYVYLTYSWWEDRTKPIESDNTIVYGTKETYVTIQHQSLCQDDEEFLRHVRALAKQDLSRSEFVEVLTNFTSFLKVHEHENYQDLVLACRYLTELESVLDWLLVAQAFWALYPWKTMIPYIPIEHLSDPVDPDSDSSDGTAESATSPTPLQA